MERKEELYEISHLTGATRADSWVDVEGGIGTLFAYASMGGRELPSSNVLHEGPAMALGKRGGFAGTHILVPRGGVAVHINAFNFPIWGLLEKFAPSFLAAMPCIAKPATATSYLTHAVVKLMMESACCRKARCSWSSAAPATCSTAWTASMPSPSPARPTPPPGCAPTRT
jgi:oxepin-CoA hydrolase/3-oxo-5,6-dehydrosuberyl-CoA semialdehyde dehydrogenase